MKVTVLAPILLQSMLAGVGCALAIRNRRSIALRLYLGFVSLATLAGIPAVIFLPPEIYRLGFFAVELTHNVLLLALAVETISTLAQRRWVLPWSVFWCALLIIGAVRQTDDLGNMALLNLTAASGFCTLGGLLLVFLRSDTRWTRQNSLTVAGVALVAFGSVIPEIPLLQEQPTIKALFLWADLPGLLALVLAAGWTAAAKPRARAMAA